jgi:hypothetical protein
MWRSAEDIVDDLDSADPARVSAALETLEFHLDNEEFLEVTLPRAHQLACFGDELPGDVATRYIKILAGCQHFSSTLTQAEAAFVAAEAAVRFGPAVLALEASLLARACNDSAAATRFLMKGLGSNRLVREIEPATAYLSHMLASEPGIRAAVVEGLGEWDKDAERVEIIARLLPELDDAERASVWR